MEQQLTYPLDYVSRAIIDEIIKDYLRTNAIVPSYTTTERGTLPAKTGQIILNSTTGKLNFYTGSAWEAITSA